MEQNRGRDSPATAGTIILSEVSEHSGPRTFTVIGAGPAGSLAGLVLARAGRRVTLVEQHRFPRDKVCGECLSALGHAVLERHGLAGAFHRAGPIPLHTTTFHPMRGCPATLVLPSPMYALSRARFDTLLLEAAVTAGVHLRQPARCESIADGTVTVRNLATNAVEQIPSDHTLLADGKAALLPRRPRPTADLGFKAHFAGVHSPPNTIELFGLPGFYVGLSPIESGLHNLAASVPARIMHVHAGSLDALFRFMLSSNPALAARFRCATRTTSWLTSPLPRFPVARRWPRHVTPIGNAAAAVEPIGGEGMGLALRSAELAAQAVLQDLPPQALRAQYQELWNTRRATCRAGALVLSHPPVARLLLPLFNCLPPLRSLALSLLQKQPQAVSLQ